VNFCASAACAWLTGLIPQPGRYHLRGSLQLLAVIVGLVYSAVLVARSHPRPLSFGRWVMAGSLALFAAKALYYFAVFPKSITPFSDVPMFSHLVLGDVFLQSIIGLGMVIWLLERQHQDSLAATAALQESERRLAQLATQVRIIPWEADPSSGRFTLVGPQAVDVLGYPIEAWYAVRFWEARLHPDDRDRAIAFSKAAARQRSDYDFEFRMLRTDGVAVWFHNIVNVVSGEAGPILLRGLMVDITAHRLLEEELRQSQKMEAVGNLAGGIAHNFNNLLTIIIGYAHLAIGKMLRQPDESQSRESLDQILRAAERASALTRQLLAFGRRQVVQLRAVDLNALVQETERLLRPLIGEQIQLRLRLGPDAGFVRADAAQIQAVIVNLALNARDAMPQGGELTIAASSASQAELPSDLDAGPYAVLSVADTGLGMDSQTRSRVFEPFFTSKEPGRGTGMGLAMVYGTAKQHGGAVEVRSELGKGSTFLLFLPQAGAGQAESAAAPALTESGRGNETVLLVEDESPVREIARRALAGRGYQVLTAHSSEEALGLFNASPRPRVDLLLTDVILPGLSGRELAERLCGLQPSLKVLFISGYTEHSRMEGREFLSKPFSPEILAAKVRKVLDARAVE